MKSWNRISLSSVLRKHIKLRFHNCDFHCLSVKMYFFAAFLNLHLKDFPIPLPVILFLIGCSFEILSFTSEQVCIVNMSILCYISNSYKYKDSLRKFAKILASSLLCQSMDACDMDDIRLDV